ncbi:hypothetical protein [Pseudophaeobacter sp.]|uniref:hypothetical protein n=1 Tax=Pseudophaeobacter sp. TaxID=1971739 RepID=UPI0032648ABB
MTNDLAITFRERLSQAYEASDFTSHRDLSLASGWSETRINRILTGQFDHSKDGPGFFGLVRVCQKLGITTDYLAGVKKWRQSNPGVTMDAVSFLQSVSQEYSPPNLKTLIRSYVRSGKRIEAFTPFLDYCDIYEVPDQETRQVTVRSVGAKSLAAMRMGEASAVIMQEAHDQASRSFQEQIFSAHLRAFNAGMTVEPDSIDQRMENKPIHVKIEYIRLTMRLADADGKECMLNYCELIPQ